MSDVLTNTSDSEECKCLTTCLLSLQGLEARLLGSLRFCMEVRHGVENSDRQDLRTFLLHLRPVNNTHDLIIIYFGHAKYG